MKYMHELKEMLCDELEQIAQKGELTTGTLDVVDKLTHSVKSIVTIMAMEEEGYSGRGSYRSYAGSYDGSYDDGSYDGGSYRRGRSATTGRFVSRRSGGYSRTGDFHEKLEELMNEAPDEATRKEIQRLISKME